MGAVFQNIRYIVFIPGFLVILGCAATFNPRPMEEVNFRDRAQTKSDDNFSVTATVLSAEETEALFGFPLYRRGIQPIWLEITNHDDAPIWFLPYSVDPDYFPPLEVTYDYHRTFQKDYNRRLDQYFLSHEMGLYIAAGATRSGFVFANLDLGTKIFNVDLVGDDNLARTFTFFIEVPGLRVDHQDVEFEKLYAPDQLLSLYEAGFREALEKLDCCTTGIDGSQPGAPLNVVIIGEGENLLRILVRSGWDETASHDPSSASSPVAGMDAAQTQRYRSVTPLVYYGRNQDASFRALSTAGIWGSVLRLWLSPMRVEEKPVWVGQISTDLDQLPFSFEKLIVDLDEKRAYFLQDLWFSQGLKKYGYVKGGGAATITESKPLWGNIEYLSDGYRLVLWLADEPIAINAVEVVDWDILPER